MKFEGYRGRETSSVLKMWGAQSLRWLKLQTCHDFLSPELGNHKLRVRFDGFHQCVSAHPFSPGHIPRLSWPWCNLRTLAVVRIPKDMWNKGMRGNNWSFRYCFPLFRSFSQIWFVGHSIWEHWEKYQRQRRSCPSSELSLPAFALWVLLDFGSWILDFDF